MAAFRPGRDKKKPKKAVLRGKMPSKRSINLAPVGVKRIDPKRVAAWLFFVLVIAGLFGKFLVMDRLGEVIRANAELVRVREQLLEEYGRIGSYSGLEDEYAHYTYSGMTETELSLVDRSAVIRLVKERTENSKEVESWSLRGNLLTLTVSAGDLSEINEIARRLEESEMVNTCTVTAAAKEDPQKTGNWGGSDTAGENIVRANIIVYLQIETEEDGK